LAIPTASSTICNAGLTICVTSPITVAATMVTISADAGPVCLRYVRLAPLWQRMIASVDVIVVTARPRRSQISPMLSTRANRE
jgi:hypothetical protein